MKKRGLIVATIVMVLVLAVSLTTATYAWFTTVSQTTVNNIEFSVGADSDVNIGLKTEHSLNPTEKITNATINNGLTADSFMWGNMEFVDGEWQNGTTGLGYEINTNLDLDGMKKAVGTGVVGASADTQWTETNPIVVASAGAAHTSVDAASVAEAKMQEDYLDVIFGVNASKNNVTKISCVVTVSPTLGTVLGMNAAIHVRYSLDGTTYYDCDIYDPTAAGSTAAAAAGAEFSLNAANNYSKLLTAVGSAKNEDYLGQGVTVEQGWASITIPIVGDGVNTLTPNDTPTQIHIQIFIAGYDGDCRNEAMGVASDIIINFVADKKTP